MFKALEKKYGKTLEKYHWQLTAETDQGLKDLLAQLKENQSRRAKKKYTIISWQKIKLLKRSMTRNT